MTECSSIPNELQKELLEVLIGEFQMCEIQDNDKVYVIDNNININLVEDISVMKDTKDVPYLFYKESTGIFLKDHGTFKEVFERKILKSSDKIIVTNEEEDLFYGMYVQKNQFMCNKRMNPLPTYRHLKKKK